MMRIETELSEGWEFSSEEYGDETFQSVTLPHDAAIDRGFFRNMKEGEAQGFRDRFVVCRYRRNISIPKKNPEHRYLLSFGGIYENSTIWVNGQAAGGRKYGYSSFTVDVTEYLQDGVNQIEVKADNRQHPADRWYSGAGIYRNVKLIEVENVHFDPWEIVVHTQIAEDTAHILVSCGLQGRRVQAELSEKGCFQKTKPENESGADRKAVVTAKAEGSSEKLELAVEHPKLWSAEEPNLYKLTLYLLDGERIADRISFSIGLRTIEMKNGQGMFVNRKRVLLKGVCLHQDVGCLGIAAKKEIFRQRLLALKEFGCNAVRPAHHTYSSDFLDLCDELGFYVYEECFDKWHGGLYGRYFQTEWQKDVDAMVKRDRNRPCIFMWGVGNEVENQGQDSMLETLKTLTDYVRTLDTRPVSCAMNPHFKRESSIDLSQVKDIQQFVDEVSDTEIYDNEERVERIAKIAQYVDVLACNYQEQWYPLIHERIPDKLILGTEVYQYFMGDFDRMQNFTDQNPVLAVRDLDYVIGSYIWTGIDYLGESMGYPAKGWGGSLIRTDGDRRPGYYLMQSYWSEKPMVHFSVMDYSLEDEGVKEHWDIPMLADHWHFPQFHKTVIPYVIASNCEEVRLYLNGKRIYIPKPEECKNRLITGFLPWLPGKVEAAGFNGGKEVCRYSMVTPKAAVKLGFIGDAWTSGQGQQTEADRTAAAGQRNKDASGQEDRTGGMEKEKSCMRLPAQAGYQIQLAVKAFDEENNPCFRESTKVRFRVEGPARILAVDAGELMGNEPYQAEAIHLFRGQASVMLELTGEPGRVCVCADAAGMRSGDFIISVE